MNEYTKDTIKRLSKEINYLFVILDNYSLNKGDKIRLNELREEINLYIKNYFNL